MNWPDILAAFKTLLEPLGVQVYDFVPESPSVPCIIVYPETVPYDRTQPGVYIIWCLAGTVEAQGAQATLMQWLSDDDGSIVALIDEDNTLGGVVDSVLPVEVRNWGIAPTQEGRPRLVQAELVCHVLA